MKRKVLVLVTVLAVMATALFAGCGKQGNEPAGTGENAGAVHTVSFMDGEETVSTVTVNDGEKVSKPADLTKDGFVFQGWFVTPTNNREFDFDAPVTEDKAAYAQWKTSGYEDSRDWVMVGSMNSWAAAAGYHMEKAGENVFTLTVNVYKDEDFKFTVLNDDGVLDYNNDTGANVYFGLLKDPGSDFEKGGGLGDAPKNILCSNDGRYTFTLVTDPENAKNELSFERIGDPVETVKAYVCANTVEDFKDCPESGKMTKNADGNYEYVLAMAAGDEAYVRYFEDGVTDEAGLLFNAENTVAEETKDRFDMTSGNIKAVADGVYKFVIDYKSKAMEVKFAGEASAYVKGSAIEEWGNKPASGQMTEKGGLYLLILEVNEGDEVMIQYFAPGDDSEYGKAFTANAVATVGAHESFDLTGNNIVCKVSGKYRFVLEVEKESITIIKEN